ncbi:MAG TPA: BON domain-containing protein [Candidatus Saccharimonadales bacterium]|nr:BON domain-containing protein [Candidatus Saccharimonadales bacterium]
MRTNPIRIPVCILLLAVGTFFTACNKAQTRTDAQVASDIQGKINADQAVRTKQIAVQAANGVVTLSGVVTSEAERSAAANDAATVSGVRTVVNNLSVQSADAYVPQNAPQPADSSQQAAPPPPSQPPASQPATSTRGVSARKPSAASQPGNQAPQSGYGSQADRMAQQRNEPQPSQQYAQNTAPQPAPAPAPPPPPAKITIPDGTELSVRMIDSLDSETSNPGDVFRATLNSPVQVDGRTVIPADADVFGRVVDVHAAGRFKGSGLLTIEVTKIGFNGHTYPVHTNQWSKQTEARGKNTAEKVGGGAALGAIIGAIAGGGKGAGIGAAVGAGAGGVTQAAIKAAQIKLGPESLLTFHLAQPVTVQPSSRSDRNAGRQHVE